MKVSFSTTFVFLIGCVTTLDVVEGKMTSLLRGKEGESQQQRKLEKGYEGNPMRDCHRLIHQDDEYAELFRACIKGGEEYDNINPFHGNGNGKGQTCCVEVLDAFFDNNQDNPCILTRDCF